MNYEIGFALMSAFLTVQVAIPARAGSVSFMLDKSETRLRRQINNCREGEFKCKNGSCIGDDLVCDGIEHCPDGSDETENLCSSLRCQPFSFTCKYGACIDKTLVCDGKKDCKDNSDELPPACNRTSSCEQGQFQCSSKQCVSEDNICDGKADCSDKSDETIALCGNLNCQSFSFRCSYGACIDSFKKCDGKPDCVDASDESFSLCGTTTTTKSPPIVTPIQTSDGDCILPNYPKHGRYTVSGVHSVKPGTVVSQYTVITFYCEDNYGILPQNNLSVCVLGKWDKNIAECTRTCKSVQAVSNAIVECSLHNSRVDCGLPLHGTVAKFSCKPLYEYMNSKPTRKCMDGTWDMSPPLCTPICGLKNGGGLGLVIGGQKVEKGNYPWQASVFTKNKNNFEQICGATILSPKAVISAAHCFTFVNGTKKSAERYVIATGKYYRSFGDKRDGESEQFSEIKEIKIPEQYYGEDGQYFQDIAVIVLKKPFEITNRVQPICIDWSEEYEAQQLKENNMGLVTGWGYTVPQGESSDELQELMVPFVSYAKCRASVPKDFRKYITPDKICSGYLSQGKSVCQGDSGGGLVYENVKNDRYYIRGVVSNSPKKNGFCDLDQYALYTKLSYHILNNGHLFVDV